MRFSDHMAGAMRVYSELEDPCRRKKYPSLRFQRRPPAYPVLEARLIVQMVRRCFVGGAVLTLADCE